MTQPDRPGATSLRVIVLVLTGAAIAMGLPILNNGPFFYFDSATYIEQAAKMADVILRATSRETAIASGLETGAQGFGTPGTDKVVLGGRSIYFGMFAYAGWKTSIWLPAIVQALTFSWLVTLLFRYLAPPRWEQVAVFTLLHLALLSSASFFVGLVMPDIWAGLMVLALALLYAFGRRMASVERFAAFAVISFAALAHSSHMVLLLCMIVFLAVVRVLPVRRARAASGSLVLPIFALAVGLFGHLAFATAVRIAYDAVLVQRPFISAHLTALGPGTRLINETCPDSGYALCAYADRLPVPWISFLFDRDPQTGVFAVASPAVQRKLSDEQGSFALRTFMAEPVATLAGLARDGIVQLWTLSIDDVALGRHSRSYIESNFPPDLVERLANTRIYDRPDLSEPFLRIIQTTAALSAVVITFWSVVRLMPGTPGRGDHPDLGNLVPVLVAGFCLNAFICGVLASPYGRFQVRLVWILPLAATLIVAGWRTADLSKVGDQQDRSLHFG